MTGGINMEYSYENTISIDDLKEKFKAEADLLTYD
jgi:hypothetical protein